MPAWDGSDCPEIEELLCAVAGEIARDLGDRLMAHLDACETCQARLGDIDRVAHASRRLWQDEADGDSTIQRAVAFRHRMHRHKQSHLLYPTSPPGKQRLLGVAAATLLAVASVLCLRPAPHASIGPDDLLTRAAQEETTRPTQALPSVRIRLEPPTGLARPSDAFAPIAFVHNGSTPFHLPRPALHGNAAALLALVEQLGFNWERPLSVTGLRAWRARTHGGLKDSVTFDESASVWILRTVVRDGIVRVLEVAAQWDTYHVLRQTLIAEGLGRVEIEELETPRRRDRYRATPADPYRATAAPAASAPSVEALDEAELDVWLALRETELDLGLDETVRVSRTATGVRLDGEASPAALRILERQLSVVPHVELALTPRVQAAMTLEMNAHSALALWTARIYANMSPARGRRFSSELATTVKHVRQRVTGLRVLASHFPDARASRWPENTRHKWQQLVDAHYAALYADLDIVDAHLAILFGSTPRCVPQSRAPRDWGRRAQIGGPLVARLDEDVDAFRLRDSSSIGEELSLKSRIPSTFSRLWTAVALCKEPGRE